LLGFSALKFRRLEIIPIRILALSLGDMPAIGWANCLIQPWFCVSICILHATFLLRAPEKWDCVLPDNMAPLELDVQQFLSGPIVRFRLAPRFGLPPRNLFHCSGIFPALWNWSVDGGRCGSRHEKVSRDVPCNYAPHRAHSYSQLRQIFGKAPSVSSFLSADG